jgi:hypothetical protein
MNARHYLGCVDDPLAVVDGHGIPHCDASDHDYLQSGLFFDVSRPSKPEL